MWVVQVYSDYSGQWFVVDSKQHRTEAEQVAIELRQRRLRVRLVQDLSSPTDFNVATISLQLDGHQVRASAPHARKAVSQTS